MDDEKEIINQDTQSPQPKPTYYVATAIPYVNGQGHIGNAIDFIIADTISRYHRIKGEDVLQEHGADQHGLKNYKTALELGKDTQTFVDEITADFVKIHQLLNISYDRFIATSSPEHKRSAQYVWQQLAANRDIYKKDYHGWYCVGCETFYPEIEVKRNNGVCPLHNQAFEETQEENYFFRLSNYTQAIHDAIESDAYKVTPVSRKNEILQVLDDGLEDISVSRPKTKLPWGVEVPDDPSHVMYVWFDALINYISVLGYPDSPDFAKYWPADVQVIGKDILRHHAAIWPAMLIGINQPLPKNLVVHGHVSSDGKKMSKTLGNVIDPFEIVEKYGTDAFRYYFMRHIPSGQDGDFSWKKFETAYNSELADSLGNLVQRTASMILRYQEGVIGEISEAEHDAAMYHQAMNNFEFDRALDVVWGMVHGINIYIEDQKPWQIAKKTDKSHLQEVLAYIVSSIDQIGHLLKPFMPQTADQIINMFVDGVVRADANVSLFPKQYHYTSPKKNG